jgi:hypothetical protein
MGEAGGPAAGLGNNASPRLRTTLAADRIRSWRKFVPVAREFIPGPSRFDCGGAMYTTLGPEALGIRGLSLPEAIDLARGAGFAGLSFDIKAAAGPGGASTGGRLRGATSSSGRASAGNLETSLNWRQEEGWEGAGDRSSRGWPPRRREIGRSPDRTYMPSGSDERSFDENVAGTARGIRPIAEILAGARGAGSASSTSARKRTAPAFRHEFVHTLAGTLDLIAAIGVDHVGLMLDAWHLYTAGETAPISTASPTTMSSSSTSTMPRRGWRETSRSTPSAPCRGGPGSSTWAASWPSSGRWATTDR